MKNQFYFVASEYFGTGEGLTHSLLITYAYPRSDRDYEVQPDYDLETNTYHPGVLKYSKEQVAILQFADIFGDFVAHGAECHTQDNFLIKYAGMIPESVKNMISSDATAPGNFKWYSKFHVNYS